MHNKFNPVSEFLYSVVSVSWPPYSAAATTAIFVILDRTDLRKSVSKAKFDVEADFEVLLATAAQNPGEIGEEQNFCSENVVEQIFLASKKKLRRKVWTTNFVFRVYRMILKRHGQRTPKSASWSNLL